MRIIRHRRIVEDSYRHVQDGAELPESGDVFVTLGRWIAQREALLGRVGEVGVRVPPDVDPEHLAEHLLGVAAVAIPFPKFTDGRGYSVARLLRERYAYRGQLRAVGQVLRDQLFYMERCGFDAFELAPGKDPQDALLAFEELSVTYQPAADEPLPLWRRRRWAQRAPAVALAGEEASG